MYARWTMHTFVAPNWIWYYVLTSMEFVGCCYCYNNNITIIIIKAAAKPTTSSCWHCNLQGTYVYSHDKILQQCCRTFLSFRDHLFLCNSHICSPSCSDFVINWWHSLYQRTSMGRIYVVLFEKTGPLGENFVGKYFLLINIL